MGIKKFENFSSQPEQNVKISKTLKPGESLTLNEITEDMIDDSLTKLEYEMKVSSKYDPKAHYEFARKYEQMEEISSLVEKTFLQRLYGGLGKNDRDFLKKAVEFLKNS